MSTSLLLGLAVQIIDVAPTAGDGDNETLVYLDVKVLTYQKTRLQVFLYRQSDNGDDRVIFFLLLVVTNSLRRSK